MESLGEKLTALESSIFYSSDQNLFSSFNDEIESIRSQISRTTPNFDFLHEKISQVQMLATMITNISRLEHESLSSPSFSKFHKTKQKRVIEEISICNSIFPNFHWHSLLQRVENIRCFFEISPILRQYNGEEINEPTKDWFFENLTNWVCHCLQIISSTSEHPSVKSAIENTLTKFYTLYKETEIGEYIKTICASNSYIFKYDLQEEKYILCDNSANILSYDYSPSPSGYGPSTPSDEAFAPSDSDYSDAF